MTDSSPTFRRRRLADELARLRDAAKLTMEDVAQALDLSRSTISRIEAGKTVRPRIRDVRGMLELYGVDAAQTELLVELARSAREKGWWERDQFKSVLPGAYVGLEAAASGISTWEPLVVPGLLQTPEYAEALTRGSGRRDTDEIARRVEARMRRQEILNSDNPPHYWAIIDEAALMRPVGSVDVQREQLRKLIDTHALDNVTVQVMPISKGAHGGLSGQFVILDFPEETGRSVVYVETPTDGLYLEEADHLDRYRLMFRHLSADAEGADASIAYLSSLVDKL